METHTYHGYRSCTALRGSTKATLVFFQNNNQSENAFVNLYLYESRNVVKVKGAGDDLNRLVDIP